MGKCVFFASEVCLCLFVCILGIEQHVCGQQFDDSRNYLGHSLDVVSRNERVEFWPAVNTNK